MLLAAEVAGPREDTGPCSPNGECMIMALDPIYFDNFLNIYNGPWTTLPDNAQGTGGDDKMTFTNALRGLIVNGNGGNDHITLGSGVSLASVVNGGDGNDRIYGNGAILNTINGGNGNDYIHGGAGRTAFRRCGHRYAEL